MTRTNAGLHACSISFGSPRKRASVATTSEWLRRPLPSLPSLSAAAKTPAQKSTASIAVGVKRSSTPNTADDMLLMLLSDAFGSSCSAASRTARLRPSCSALGMGMPSASRTATRSLLAGLVVLLVALSPAEAETAGFSCASRCVWCLGERCVEPLRLLLHGGVRGGVELACEVRRDATRHLIETDSPVTVHAHPTAVARAGRGLQVGVHELEHAHQRLRLARAGSSTRRSRPYESSSRVT